MGIYPRLLGHIFIICSRVVLRTVTRAYKDILIGHKNDKIINTLISNKMTSVEATKILNLEAGKFSKSDIITRFKQLYKNNEPSNEFLGSPYIQKKVKNAKIILENEVHNQSKTTNCI